MPIERHHRRAAAQPNRTSKRRRPRTPSNRQAGPATAPRAASAGGGAYSSQPGVAGSEHLPATSPGQVSRLLKRMWTHGLIKKVGGTYKYYVSELGRIVITAGLKLKNLVLIPELARSLPA